MLVDEVMHRGVISCPPDTPLAAVAEELSNNRIHAVFVSGDWSKAGYDELVWGVVFDLDVVRAAREGIDGRFAGELAHQDMVTVPREATLSEAMSLMAEHGLSHLVVVDAPLEPVGILSTLDVMRALAPRR